VSPPKHQDTQHRASIKSKQDKARIGRHDLKNKGYLEALYRHLTNTNNKIKRRAHAWSLLKAEAGKGNSLAKKLLQLYRSDENNYWIIRALDKAEADRREARDPDGL